GSPLLGVVFGTPDQRVMREDVASRQVADALVTRFEGNSATPVDIITTAAVRAGDVADFARTLSGLPDVASVSSSAGTFVDGVVQVSAADAAFAKPDA